MLAGIESILRLKPEYREFFAQIEGGGERDRR
jgi:hypothetical protein